MTAKRCPGCGETKPLEEFARDRSRRDGRGVRCRACYAEYYRAKREAILDQQRDYQRARRARAAIAGPRRYFAAVPFPADRLAEVTYNGAHKRVRNFYGPARAYQCSATGCERQAEEWAHTGTPDSDPHHRTATITDARNGTVREVSYSLNPARYAPLCHGCHVRLDHGIDVFADAPFTITA